MRIDSAILTNAIITASTENPIVSGSSQVNITQTTGYSTFSSSIQTYTNAKVNALVNAAPGALDTLDELAAALGDDANLSASIASTIGSKLPTATHTAFSSSNASALRTEYKAGDTALSSSAASALRTEYVASTAALSASAHTRREQISASLDATIDALDSLGISTDTERGALSSSAHTQREAIKGLATTANNSLSGSSAGALRTEYKAGDTALSSSAHTQREAIKGLATTANNSLSGSSAGALRTEYVAGDSALSASAEVRRNQLHALQLLSSSVGATINDNAVKLSGIEAGATADQTNAQIAAAVEAASDSNTFTDADHSKLNAIEAGADVTDTTNVTNAGALMDSELTDLAGIKSLDTSTILASGSIGATINDNAVKLSGIESGATADQSASEILTAIKTVDGGGSGLDADTLDGEQGAYYAPSASMKTYVDAKVAGVVDTAPAALNTLNELAAALGDDANFATTTATSIGEKLVIASNLSDLNNAATARTNLGVAKGISDGNVLAANDAVADDDFLRINGTEVEGLSAAEVRSAINVENGATADQTAAEIRTLVGTGNNNFVPAAGSAGQFLKHDGTFGTPSYTTNTNTVDMGDGFTVSATTDTTATTITEGDDLFFAAGTGITCETTADGTVTISSTVTDTNTQLSTADVRGKFSAGTNISISNGEISATDTNTVDMGDGFVVSADTNTVTTTITENQTLSIVGGTNCSTVSNPNGTITINSTDTNTQNSRADLSLDTGDDVVFGTVKADDTTASTSKTTGALLSDGGLGVAGDIHAGGDIVAYASSDERLKDNIIPISNAIDKVNQLKGVTWDWNDNADETQKQLPNVGVIAQDVEKVFPQLVKDRDSGYKAVDYDKLVGLLIESVKELSAKVEKLENK